ncbi:hypothetical protein SAY86_004507 [Trapa natans]|uniref:Uncharacterized protein n=1 Tax=Trapa natans TaxID=22666 RepID=A0AAN7MEK4_TRANT|nr:hypothetical protein SAY86_004507 [Trapa natans]
MVAHGGGFYGGNGANGSSSSSSTSGGSGGVGVCVGIGVSGGMAKPALKKGPWTATEDAILVEYVKKQGEGNWNAVQKNTSLSRCGKSCRLRWTNHLRPNLRKGSFTPEEELLIIQLHSELGNKWARMAAQLPGRTDNEIKNYWNTRIKRRIRQGLPLYPSKEMAHFQGQGQQAPSLLLPEEPLDQPQPVARTAIRGRPPLQIPTQSVFQILGGHQPSSQCPSPSQTPVLLSPQPNHQLKTAFANSLSLFDQTRQISPSTSTLPSPHSPTTILSPSYNDTNIAAAAFPGFALTASVHPYQHHTSPLPSPTGGFFQFSPLPQLLSASHVYATPVEFPSSQMYIRQMQKPMHIPQELHDHEINLENHGNMSMSNPSLSESNRGIELLEDLLDQTNHQAVPTNNSTSLEQSHTSLLNNNMQENQEHQLKSTDVNGWNPDMGSINVCEGSGMVNNKSMHEELSNFLQSIGSPAVHEEFSLTDGLSMPPLDFSAGPTTSEDSLGLDMQQIVSLFQVEPTASASSPWNNLPSIY